VSIDTYLIGVMSGDSFIVILRMIDCHYSERFGRKKGAKIYCEIDKINNLMINVIYM
jgi:hypothetical protein